MKINIVRERWCVILDGKEIFCGQARDYHFNKLTDVKDCAIKTYLSEAKARCSFIRSWWDAEELIEAGRIKFVKVTESIIER